MNRQVKPKNPTTESMHKGIRRKSAELFLLLNNVTAGGAHMMIKPMLGSGMTWEAQEQHRQPGRARPGGSGEMSPSLSPQSAAASNTASHCFSKSRLHVASVTWHSGLLFPLSLVGWFLFIPHLNTGSTSHCILLSLTHLCSRTHSQSTSSHSRRGTPLAWALCGCLICFPGSLQRTLDITPNSERMQSNFYSSIHLPLNITLTFLFLQNDYSTLKISSSLPHLLNSPYFTYPRS